MQKSFDVAGPVDLDLELASGEVVVDPSLDGRVEVELTAHGPEAEKLVDAARVELRESGGRQQVVVHVPQRAGGGFGLAMVFGRNDITCRVRCPEGSFLRARTKSADVTATGRLGSGDVATASGDVELGRIDGQTTAKTASGDVTVAGAGAGVSVATASGDVDVATADGPVKVATASGDVEVASAGGDVRVDTASGDVGVGAVSAGQVGINSASGDIEIGVRRGSRAYLDCSTVSGDASSELDATDEAAEGEGPLVEIRARTMSGDIRITRALEVHA